MTTTTNPTRTPRPRRQRWLQTDLYLRGPVCFSCRQAGQPVLPVTVTLRATDKTPTGWPDQVEVETHRCVDEATCRRVAAGVAAARRKGTTENMQ